MTTTSTPVAGGTVFDQLGITPVINARGNNTVLGGSTPSARVRQAMLDAERYYVDMQQLLERSGIVIAGLLGCEAAFVTPGAAAALALGTAACMAGADLARVAQLPDTTGLKNRVLIQAGQRYHYEHAVTVPGARLVEVAPTDLERALDDGVAAVLYPAHLEGTPGTLSLAEVLERAHAHGVPVLVDAAGRVYPIEMFKRYAAGADLVAFGAKYIGALNASGILCGRKDLVAAAAPHSFIGFETVAWGASFGRPLKLDRQTIVAVVAAVREWLETDHEARVARLEQRLEGIASELRGAHGVSLEIVSGDGPDARRLRVGLEPGVARLDRPALVDALWNATPAIAVDQEELDPHAIYIHPATLREEDDGVVASRVGQLLL